MKKKIRKSLNKSGFSECDICKQSEILVKHHLNGRAIENCDKPSNLCNICPNCHQKVHNGIIIIEKWAGSTSGKILIWHRKEQESITGEESKCHLV